MSIFPSLTEARGTQLIDDPFWWSADDKYFRLRHRRDGGRCRTADRAAPAQTPAAAEATSFRNLRLVDWDAVFGYMGFSALPEAGLRRRLEGRLIRRRPGPSSTPPASGARRDLTMMAQEAIDFTDFYRIYVLGRERVHLDPCRSAPTAPTNPIVLDAPPIGARLPRSACGATRSSL